MNYMDILFIVLTSIAGLTILLLLFLLFWQFLGVFGGLRKPKEFPKAKRLRKFALIIPAHNEAVVIGNTVENLLTNLDYPKDLYDVFVCADNCTDNTKELAMKAGAKVYERFDDNPDHKRASFPIKLLIDKVLEREEKYDAIIKFDADNIPSRNYLHAMNDALESGLEIARAHEAPTNMGQNVWTSVSACYYCRDSRLMSNFRERHNWNSMLSGAGMMVSTRVLKEIGGWDAMGQIDDAEFTVNRLLEKKRVGYVPSAIVYEDQPSSRKDSAARNSRMANGLNKLYWSKSMKLLGMFFKTGKATYLDLWSQLTFVQIPILIAIVIPVYAVFYFTTLILEMCGIRLYGVLFQGENAPLIAMIALLAGGVAALLFYYFFFTLQSAIAVSKDKDVLGPDYKKNARKGVWLGAVAMFAYMGSINSGVTKKKVAWKELKRNAPTEKKEEKEN